MFQPSSEDVSLPANFGVKKNSCRVSRQTYRCSCNRRLARISGTWGILMLLQTKSLRPTIYLVFQSIQSLRYEAIHTSADDDVRPHLVICSLHKAANWINFGLGVSLNWYYKTSPICFLHSLPVQPCCHKAVVLSLIHIWRCRRRG